MAAEFGDDDAVASWRSNIGDFSNQMFSLLNISDTLIPKMESGPESFLGSRLDVFKNILTKEERAEFGSALRWLAGSIEKFPSPPQGGNDSSVDSEDRTYSFKSPNVSTAMLQLIHDVATGLSRPNHAMIRQSLLVTAVANYETFFGNMAQEIYKINKSALNDSDYSFSLQELAEFNTIDDAREFLIERRVESLMRDSIDGWDKWLGRAVKGASMRNLPLDWPSTREVFARRNLLVHNGGVVNRIYLSLISQSGKDVDQPATLGKRLTVDAEYFSTAVQNLLALGVTLATDVAERLLKARAEPLLSSLLFTTEMSARRSAWVSSAVMSKYLLSKKLDRKDQLRAQAANWVARKNVSGIEDIRAEVEGWDITGLSDEFAHHKAVLLGDKEKAVEAIEDLIVANKLALVEVALNPIYAEILEELPSLADRATRKLDRDPE